MIVGFKHRLHDNNLEGRVISAATGSDWIHTELIFEEGFSASSWAGNRGVTYKRTQDTVKYPQYWEFYDLGEFDETPLIGFLNAQMGKRYDWESILFAYGLPLQVQNKDQWTCSELVYHALAHYGPVNLTTIDSKMLTPGQVRQVLLDAGYRPIDFPYSTAVTTSNAESLLPKNGFAQHSAVLIAGGAALVLLIVVIALLLAKRRVA